MKKILALLLALMMVLIFSACGGDEKPSGNEDNSPSSSEKQGGQSKPEETQSPATETLPEEDWWSKAEYAEYTSVIPEPTFPYAITGVIGNMGLSFKSTAAADQFEAWRQTLLDNGFEENSVAGETWTVFSDTHSIAHSGGGYFNIQIK